MTEQQMPARIWRDHFVIENDEIHCKPVEYTRADIAERMAEALESFRGCSLGSDSKSENELDQLVIEANAVLSAFKDSAQ